MGRKLRFFCCFLVLLSIPASVLFVKAQTYLSEGFESGLLPSGWALDKTVGNVNWLYTNGGNSGKPSAAHGGSYNAQFYYADYLSYTTKLITKEINLSGATIAELSFWHAQVDFSGDLDRLKVYYRTSAAGSWVLLAYYNTPVSAWTQRTLLLPETSGTFYLAFEGIANYGYGVCIDDILVKEGTPVPKSLDTLSIHQASSDILLRNTPHNPILRIDLDILGNAGTLLLNSLIVNSLNTSDADISASGVRLFSTPTSSFATDHLLAAGKSWSGGTVTFSAIGHNLTASDRYLWVALDIASGAVVDNIVDAYIPANGINIAGLTYPATDLSPAGERIIRPTIFFDDFESYQAWTFKGEFEKSIATGAGGSKGNPDPSAAYSGDSLIGTDLSGLNTYAGDYEAALSSRAYKAISPVIDCEQYQDVQLLFRRWLNIDQWDKAYVDISSDSGVTWHQLWTNGGLIQDNQWTQQSIDVSAYADEQKHVMIRFCLGSTDGTNQYSGWNIDDVILSGDYLNNEVQVTNILKPYSRCNDSGLDSVQVVIRNNGAEPTSVPLPVVFSPDGGITVYQDNVTETIAPQEELTFTFSMPVSMAPGAYPLMFAATALTTDKKPQNDKAYKNIHLAPMLVPPYRETFEDDDGNWSADGNNPSWQWGVPSGAIINDAASGTRAWVTGLNADYNSNELSYLYSPCFDLSIAKSPIIDMQLAVATEPHQDGAAVQYSTDCGITWSFLGISGDTVNWYDTDSVQAMADATGFTDGWHNGTGNWAFAKYHIDTLRYEPCVRFRYVFASTDAVEYNGVGVDDFRLYDDNIDLTIAAIAYPTNACELSDAEYVSVTLTNPGTVTITTLDTVVLYLQVNDSLLLADSFRPSQDLAPGDTLSYTFSMPVDMTVVNTYEFTVYLSGNGDYNPVNDTLATVVVVYGNPTMELGANIRTAQPDTLVFSGGNYAAYLWQDGSSAGSFAVHELFSRYYALEVTDTNGCKDQDTLFVRTTDLSLESIVSPISRCALSDSEAVVLTFRNASADTLPAGDTIVARLVVNDSLRATDTLLLATALYPGGLLSYTFRETLDLSGLELYEIESYLSNQKDVSSANDSLTKSVKAFGYPVADLGPDIHTTQPDTVVLKTGLFAGYLWSGNSSGDTLAVTDLASGWYLVMVTDTNGCTDVDSLFLRTTDLAIDSIWQPRSRCQWSETEQVVISIINLSHDTVAAGDTLVVGCQIKSDILVTDTVVLGHALNPADTLMYIFPAAFDLTEDTVYILEVWLEFYNDVYALNDTTHKVVKAFGFPTINLGEDIQTNRPDTVVLRAYPFASYAWSNGSTSASCSVTTPGVYALTVTDIYGCTDADSIVIRTADIGIVGLVNLLSSCALTDTESIQIRIHNNSAETIAAGDTVVAVCRLDNAELSRDTILLVVGLPADSSFVHTFSATADMSAFGAYELSFDMAFSKDVFPGNDTLTTVIEAWGMPAVELGDDIATTRADTVVLNAGIFASYQWNTGASVAAINAATSGVYAVTVYDHHGCEDADTIQVFTTDLAPGLLLTPISSCQLSELEPVSIAIHNTSPDTVFAGATLDIFYAINGLSTVHDTLVLSEHLLPDSSVVVAFDDEVNLSVGELFVVTAWIDFAEDIFPGNDTIQTTIEVYGFPTVWLGQDIHTTRPDTVTLVAGIHHSYLWNTGSTEATQGISGSGMFSVTVADVHGCTAVDSLFVKTVDVGIVGILTPVSGCQLDMNESISCIVQNNSADTIWPGDSITLTYRLNNGTWVTEKRVLSSKPLLLGDSVLFTFAQPADLTADSVYTVTVALSFDDVYRGNDTLVATVRAFGFPFTDLGAAIYTARPDTVVLDAGDFDRILWEDGSTLRLHYLEAAGTYQVTVFDTNGCLFVDSIKIMFYAPDLAIREINGPQSACELGIEPVSILIENKGTPLWPGETISLWYILDGIVGDSVGIVLAETMHSDSVFTHVFDLQADLGVGNTHILSAHVHFAEDVDTASNQLAGNVETYGYPDVDLGYDITSAKVDTITLDAGAFAAYLWNTGDSSAVYQVPASGTYAVTVTDEYGCTDADTITIRNLWPNFSLTTKTAHLDACLFSDREIITVQVNNTSDYLVTPDDTVLLKYVWQNVAVTESFNDTLIPGDSALFSFAQPLDMSAVGVYHIVVSVGYTRDLNPANNTASYAVESFGYPAPDLGADTIKSALPDTIILNAGAGYHTYAWNTGSAKQAIVFSQLGWYTVTVTDANGCAGQDSVFVLSTQGIRESVQLTSVKVFPIPARQELQYELSLKEHRQVQLELSDMAGKVLYRGQLEGQHLSGTINTGTWAQGIYYLSVKISQTKGLLPDWKLHQKVKVVLE